MIESTVFTRHFRVLLSGLLLAPFAAGAQTFVIEADSRGQNADRFEIISGSWVPSNSKSRASSLGATSVAMKLESQTGTVQFRPIVRSPGDYYIELTWPANANVSGALVKISTDGNELISRPITMDATEADRWLTLGVHPLPEGERTIVELSIPGTAVPADASIPLAAYADGVRFRASQATGSQPAWGETEDNPFESGGRATSGGSTLDPMADPFGGDSSEFSVSGGTTDNPFENPPPAGGGSFASPPTSSDSPFSSPPSAAGSDPFAAVDSARLAADPFGAPSDARSDAIFGSNVEFQPSGGAEILDYSASGGTEEGFASPPSGRGSGSSALGQARAADPFATDSGSSDPFSEGTAAGSSTSSVWDPFGGGASVSAPASSQADPFAGSDSGRFFGDAAAPTPRAPAREVAASARPQGQDLRNFAADRSDERSEPVFMTYESQSAQHAAAPTPAGNVDWFYDLEEALEAAKSKERPVLLVFLGGNKQSETFQNEVLSDSAAVDVIGKFIAVQLDFRLDNALARKYNVPSSPYAVVLNKFGYTKSHVSMMTDARRFERAVSRLAD